ncbi:MAG: dihydropteroate synthase [Acidobacteria bacterium]|nr:dihydropteroate synthase [Acidobacteriota bacterium]
MTVSSRKSFHNLLKEEILVMDGAYGTFLSPHADGFAIEELNIRKPDIVKATHQKYADAGADIVKSNTFGIFHSIFKGKLEREQGLSLIRAGVRILKDVESVRNLIKIASFGPMTPGMWGYTPEEAEAITTTYRMAAEQALSCGIDGILFETFSDLLEMSIAIHAVRMVSTDIPLICQFTFQDGSLTLSGSPAANAAVMLHSLHADVIGVNCSTGPSGILGHVAELSRFSDGFLSMAPNAGLPQIQGQTAVYPDVRGEMLELLPRALELGVRIVGTCCGSTPEYTASLRTAVDGIPGRRLSAVKRDIPDVISSGRRLYDFRSQPFCAVGERLNLSGNRTFLRRFRNDSESAVKGELERQFSTGYTDAVDINLDPIAVKSPSVWQETLLSIERGEYAPILSIDTLYPDLMDAAARFTVGKPIYNSTDLTEKRFSRMAELYHRHRGKIVALLMTGNRLPKSYEQRLEALEILERLRSRYGIPAEEILVDPLALSLATGVDQFNMVRKIVEKTAYKTIIGLSNFSHGLADRSRMNAFLLGQLTENGLSAAIADTSDPNICAAIRLGNALFHGEPLIREEGEKITFSEPFPEVGGALLSADPDAILDILEQNRKQFDSPYVFLEKVVSPKMEAIGEAFEEKKLYLPQLIVAGETMKKLLKNLKSGGVPSRKKGQTEQPVLLFTVQNDIHDIGKNIVMSVLQGFGIPAEDGGVDRSPDEIVEIARAKKAGAVGLSALMTTSLASMEKTILRLKTEMPGLPVLVGGAVVTRRFAEEIGADGYGKTAFEAVHVIRNLKINGNDGDNSTG